MISGVLEVRHLRLVRAIAEEGGVTRAAARLHLTQSAVSHQLADLERRLGLALFARIGRQLTLTPAGRRVLEAGRELLTDLARLESELHRAGDQRRRVLRVAQETFTSYHWLPKVVAAMRKEHPHVDVRIVGEARRDPTAALVRGSLDVAVVCTPVRDRTLVTTPLVGDQWAVILAPSHPLARKTWVGLSDLEQTDLFAHDGSRGDVARFRELLASERSPLPRVVGVPFTEALVDLVRAGLGAGLVSRWAVSPWAERKEIVCRRFTRRPLEERWSAIHRRDAPAEVARFVALLH